MKEPDYIAIWDAGADCYKWYDRSTFAEKHLPPLTAEEQKTCREITYTSSGRLVHREDGEIAEIWIPLKCPNDRAH